MPILPRTLALVALLTAGCVLVMGPTATPASAHAPLVGTSPKAGSKLTKQPRRVLVKFGEEIRSGSVVVKNASGKIVSKGPNGKDPTDVRRLRVALKPHLKNGRYKVSWKVVSADGDPEAGTFAFRLI